MRATATCTCRVFQGDETRRLRGAAVDLRRRPRARGRDLGRARHWPREALVLRAARGPGQARAHARIKDAFDPHGILNPGTIFQLTIFKRGRTDERCPGADPNPRGPRRRRVLHDPGTSEMHFVAALDSVGEMRGVLALFEGVVTGAADGYARMADKPAATLLHLGPGLGNGLANLPQRPQGPHRGGQHRGRPCDLPQAVRRAARVRHRDGGPQRLDVHPIVDQDRRGWRPTRRTPSRPPSARPVRWATLILPADVSLGETAASPRHRRSRSR